MKNKAINLDIKVPFGNLYRKSSVVIGVRDSQGKIILGAKNGSYPPTISRLLGGGIHEGETAEEAARRELAEELNVATANNELVPIAKLAVAADDQAGNHYATTIWVYYLEIGDTPVRAGDDVTNLVYATTQQLKELADAYDTLPDTLWYKGVRGEFCWADYGKLYGKVHRILWEYLDNETPS